MGLLGPRLLSIPALFYLDSSSARFRDLPNSVNRNVKLNPPSSGNGENIHGGNLASMDRFVGSVGSATHTRGVLRMKYPTVDLSTAIRRDMAVNWPMGNKLGFTVVISEH